MLTFKQFLSEAPLVDDFANNQSGRQHNAMMNDIYFNDRIFALRRSEKQTGVKHKPFAYIGSYTLHHAPPTEDWGQHSILVTYRKKPVGHVSFTVRKNTKIGDLQIPRHLDPTEIPRFLIAHSGKRAPVRQLASKVYMATTKHFGMPILSGSTQTPGGKSIWDGISRLSKNVLAVNADTYKQIPNYDPDKHNDEVYDTENSRGINWTLIHHPGKQHK